jgi:phosphatidylglycerophosphate synthase
VNAELSQFYLLKVIAVFGAIVLIVAARLRRYHPFAAFGPANQITTVRALLVSLVAGLIGEAHATTFAATAAALSTLATALDGFDGWLARRTGMTSGFGARFDMEVDALLIQVLSILVWRYGKAGAWVLASGLVRYVFLAAGWAWRWIRVPLFASVRRKAICVIQIGGLIVALVPSLTWPQSAWIAAGALGALAYSFLIDTLWLWQRRSEL